MPSLQQRKHPKTKQHEVWHKAHLGLWTKVGHLQHNWLIVTFDGNWHKDSNALGIPRLVIEGSELSYEFIRITYKDRIYETTRVFFFDFAKELNVSVEPMLCLRINKFGLARSVKYKRDMQLAGMDFDLFGEYANRITEEDWKNMTKSPKLKKSQRNYERNPNNQSFKN